MKEKEVKFELAPTTWNRFLAIFLAVAALGLTLMFGNVDINFSSTFDAVNQQSDGSSLNSSFTFELGSFDSAFIPTSSNTDQWMSHWMPVSGGGGDSSASYTQVSVPGSLAPNTGMTNTFSGSVELGDNSSPFSTTDDAYIWGFDERSGSGTGEWVLVTNPDWTYPLVTGGIQLPVDVQVSDDGTVAVLGSVNPEFANLGDDPHLVTERVLLMPVPEPSVGLLFLGGIGMLLVRRRRR